MFLNITVHFFYVGNLDEMTDECNYFNFFLYTVFVKKKESFVH